MNILFPISPQTKKAAITALSGNNPDLMTEMFLHLLERICLTVQTFSITLKSEQTLNKGSAE